MTVLSGVPLELAETEAVEVQIVLLMTAKQKVCSCILALQLNLIVIRNFFFGFKYSGTSFRSVEMYLCICSLPEKKL